MEHPLGLSTISVHGPAGRGLTTRIFQGLRASLGERGQVSLSVGQLHKPQQRAWLPSALQPQPCWQAPDPVSWRGSWLLRKTIRVKQCLRVAGGPQGPSPSGPLSHTGSRSGEFRSLIILKSLEGRGGARARRKAMRNRTPGLSLHCPFRSYSDAFPGSRPCCWEGVWCGGTREAGVRQTLASLLPNRVPLSQPRASLSFDFLPSGKGLMRHSAGLDEP